MPACLSVKKMITVACYRNNGIQEESCKSLAVYADATFQNMLIVPLNQMQMRAHIWRALNIC